MKTIAAIVCAFALEGCTLQFPVGERGEYGTIVAGYIPPPKVGEYQVLNSPTLGDK